MGEEKGLSEKRGAYAGKVKRAAQMLLFQRHRRPGVKGWELKRSLGRDFMKVVDLLNTRLGDLGLRVSVVYEGREPEGRPSEEELERAFFYVVLKDASSVESLSGWRVDEVAGLAAVVAFIASRQGKAARRDVEGLLRVKFPEWRVDLALDKYVRRGYLDEGEGGVLYVGWRSRAEIDQKLLLDLLLGEPLK